MFYNSLSSENEEKISHMMKERRVVINMTQKEVASKSGVNVRSIQNFEQNGGISLINLLKLMSVYRMDERLVRCLEDRSWWTIEQLERSEKRKRAR